MSTDINISNYEDYLYSYVDGELQAEEVSALESFLEMHPQFQAELDLLMSTRLQPEAVVFNNKASLYRGSEISLQNYEGSLLSYIDGELNQQEKTAFEQFVARHAPVQQELKVWQATKLQADTSVRFEDKSVLYRKTSHRIAIRPAYWWGAAAVVAGALFFLTLSDTTETKEVVAVNQPEVKTTTPAIAETIPGTEVAKGTETTPGTEAAKGATAPVVAATAPKIAPQDHKNAPKAARQEAAPVKETLLAATSTTNQTMDLTNVPTEKPAEQPNNKAIAAEISQQLKQIPGSEVAANRTSIEVSASSSLATPAPAAEPGELIMSVTGNGLESKVLDKVTNVARFFAKKRNK